MINLGNKDLVSVSVHARIDVAGSKVMRVRQAMGLDPTDRAWLADQNFVFMEGVALVLSPNFCALAQVLSCLPDIYKEGRIRNTKRRLV